MRVTAIAVFAREALVGYWVQNLDWFQQNSSMQQKTLNCKDDNDWKIATKNCGSYSTELMFAHHDNQDLVVTYTPEIEKGMIMFVNTCL